MQGNIFFFPCPGKRGCHGVTSPGRAAGQAAEGLCPDTLEQCSAGYKACASPHPRIPVQLREGAKCREIKQHLPAASPGVAGNGRQRLDTSAQHFSTCIGCRGVVARWRNLAGHIINVKPDQLVISSLYVQVPAPFPGLILLRALA